MKNITTTSVARWFVGGMGNPFRLDLRSLALYRVAIGLVLLADLLMRWSDMTVHYTNTGVLSQELATQTYAHFSFGFHGLYDSWWWIFGLFSVQVLLAIMLIVGYRTRLVTALSFVMLVSLQHRNDVVLNSGDVLLRAQLFWSILLPMNKYFSVDLAQSRVVRTAAKTAFSPATMAIVIQTALLFWQTSTFKSGAPWRETYEALYFALNAEAFAAPWGTWLSQFRTPMRMLTWLAIMVEDYAPILLIMPFFNVFARSLALIGILGLYGGIITTMTIGVFPFTGVATVLVLVPCVAWAWAEKKLQSRLPKDKLTVYYDESCGICVKFIRLLSSFGVTRNVAVKHVYSTKKTTELSNKHNSWVGKVGNKHLFKADVFIAILRRSYVWWIVAPIITLKPIHTLATKIYEFVASRRKSICKPPKPMTWWRRWLKRIDAIGTFAAQGAVLILLVSIIVWVRSDLPDAGNLRVNSFYRQTIRMVRLDQYWNMFSPIPVSYSSWVVVEGQTPNGSVDAWRPYWDDNSTVVDYGKPVHGYDRHVNPRWRRYITRLGDDGYDQHRAQFLQYMCEQWNSKNPENQIGQIRFVEMREPTNVRGNPEDIKVNTLTETFCQVGS